MPDGPRAACKWEILLMDIGNEVGGQENGQSRPNAASADGFEWITPRVIKLDVETAQLTQLPP